MLKTPARHVPLGWQFSGATRFDGHLPGCRTATAYFNTHLHVITCRDQVRRYGLRRGVPRHGVDWHDGALRFPRGRVLGMIVVARMWSVPLSGGLVLLHHAGRDAPARADRDALLLRPGPDIDTVLTA